MHLLWSGVQPALNERLEVLVWLRQAEYITAWSCLQLLLLSRTFVKKLTQVSVLIRTENTTAVAYINNMAGSSGSDVVPGENLHITTQYLPRVENTIANAESQIIVDWFNWKLNPNLYRRIDHHFGLIEK